MPTAKTASPLQTVPRRPIEHPFPEPPAAGHVRTVAPGILWLRMPLPFALNHINLYLFEDKDGWTLFDTGIADPDTIAIWENLLNGDPSGPLMGRPITRLIVSHHHPDHVGLAGWMHQRFAPIFHMSQGEYLFTRGMLAPSTPMDREAYARHFHACGMDAAGVEGMLGRGLSYLNRITGLPPTYERLRPGDKITLGGRQWRVLTGAGHTLEQIMLHCAADNLLVTGDQVLTHISPNVSVPLSQPNADPLISYLRSLAELDDVADGDTLILPAHHLPFRGLSTRVEELETHHADRCDSLLDACRDHPSTVIELLPVLFSTRKLDSHQTGFAIGEALAHINHLLRLKTLTRVTCEHGVWHHHTTPNLLNTAP